MYNWSGPVIHGLAPTFSPFCDPEIGVAHNEAIHDLSLGVLYIYVCVFIVAMAWLLFLLHVISYQETFGFVIIARTMGSLV